MKCLVRISSDKLMPILRDVEAVAVTTVQHIRPSVMEVFDRMNDDIVQAKYDWRNLGHKAKPIPYSDISDALFRKEKEAIRDMIVLCATQDYVFLDIETIRMLEVFLPYKIKHGGNNESLR